MAALYSEYTLVLPSSLITRSSGRPSGVVVFHSGSGCVSGDMAKVHYTPSWYGEPDKPVEQTEQRQPMIYHDRDQFDHAHEVWQRDKTLFDANERWHPDFRPRAQAKKAGWDSILLGSLPLEKPARLGVKGRSERSLLPEPLQKRKSRPPDPRWYDPFLPDVRPDMPAARQ